MIGQACEKEVVRPAEQKPPVEWLLLPAKTVLGLLSPTYYETYAQKLSALRVCTQMLRRNPGVETLQKQRRSLYNTLLQFRTARNEIAELCNKYRVVFVPLDFKYGKPIIAIQEYLNARPSKSA